MGSSERSLKKGHLILHSNEGDWCDQSTCMHPMKDLIEADMRLALRWQARSAGPI
jgi:hypothetical protein